VTRETLPLEASNRTFETIEITVENRDYHQLSQLEASNEQPSLDYWPDNKLRPGGDEPSFGAYLVRRGDTDAAFAHAVQPLSRAA
jgi:hypothetical protein